MAGYIVEHQGLYKKWGWYATICDLAKNDIQEIDKITEKTVIEVFTFLSYMTDKNNAEEQEYKFQQADK